MLELVKVKKVYTSKAGETSALNEVSITLPDKGLVFITGKSGSGKTTLLNVIGGLDGFDDGEIIIQGKKFSEFTPEEYNSYRNTFVGFIFQGYNLLSEYTIEKNIRLANELQGKESNIDEINALLESVDLGGLNHRLPSELSGGQKQRVAIARALIKNPKIIIADEPTGALDSNTGVQVLETLKKLSKDRLVIIVSHDLELAEVYADRIINLIDGDIVSDVTLSDTAIKGNVAENGNDFIVKSRSELTPEENKSLLTAIKNGKNVYVSDDITIREKSDTVIEKEEYQGEEVELLSSKMKLKSSVDLGLKSLKVKPLRLAFTIFLSVIAFAVFGLFDTIASYSNAKVIVNLLNGGDYNSVQISAENVGSSRTKLTFSNTEIERIKWKTGYNFRPIADIDDKVYKGINNQSVITEIVSNMTVGSDYYPNGLDGFVEFGEDEISSNGIIDKGGFYYKIVYGRYPVLNTSADSKYDEIAISTLVADGIMHYLAGENLGYATLKNYQDFVEQDAIITLNSKMYKIVGIIDCGKIPEKYNALQKVPPSLSTKILASDYKAYINSGCYLMAFVPKGFIENKLHKNNRINNYYTNEYMYELLDDRNFRLAKLSALEDTRFYNISDIPSEKIFLFNKDDKITNKNDLPSDSILISLSNFNQVYYRYRNDLYHTPTYYNMMVSAYNVAVDSTNSYEDRANAVYQMAEAFKLAGMELERSVNLNRETKGLAKRNSYTMKIVGFYVDVNTDIGPSTEKYYPLAVTKDALSNIGVYNDQGYYSRIIAPLNQAGLSCNSNSGAEFLASLISKEKGYRLNFHNNDIYESIDKNGKTITEFTLIALIASLVLALFSIFMLFNYISTSIVSKRQSIGILRALGCKGKDVLTMFITESLVISLINGIIASGVAYVGCLVVNYYIKNFMNMTVDFAIFGVRQVAFIMLASIVAGILSSIMPISKICKEKPVDLIRKP